MINLKEQTDAQIEKSRQAKPAFMARVEQEIQQAQDRQLDLVKINNGNGNVLPIPAVFVVDQDGKVAWRSVHVDYRGRAEPAEIISVLENLVT